MRRAGLLAARVCHHAGELTRGMSIKRGPPRAPPAASKALMPQSSLAPVRDEWVPVKDQKSGCDCCGCTALLAQSPLRDRRTLTLSSQADLLLERGHEPDDRAGRASAWARAAVCAARDAGALARRDGGLGCRRHARIHGSARPVGLVGLCIPRHQVMDARRCLLERR